MWEGRGVRTAPPDVLQADVRLFAVCLNGGFAYLAGVFRVKSPFDKLHHPS